MLPGVDYDHVIFMNSERGLHDSFCYRVIRQAKTNCYEDLPRK